MIIMIDQSVVVVTSAVVIISVLVVTSVVSVSVVSVSVVMLSCHHVWKNQTFLAIIPIGFSAGRVATLANSNFDNNSTLGKAIVQKGYI